MDQVQFSSSRHGTTWGPYGGNGGGPGTSDGGGRCTLEYISGRSGSMLDALKLHYNCDYP